MRSPIHCKSTALPRATALIAIALALSACNITTAAMTGGFRSSAAGSTPERPVRERRLTQADVSVPDATQFINQTEDMLTLHFGPPDLTRREGNATIHQFRTNTRGEPCIILAFLYEERGDDAPRIRHLSVRRGATEAAEPEQCLRRLALAHKNRRIG